MARYSSKPKKLRWIVAKKIFNYLLATADMTLMYSRESGVDVIKYI